MGPQTVKYMFAVRASEKPSESVIGPPRAGQRVGARSAIGSPPKIVLSSLDQLPAANSLNMIYIRGYETVYIQTK